MDSLRQGFWILRFKRLPNQILDPPQLFFSQACDNLSYRNDFSEPMACGKCAPVTRKVIGIERSAMGRNTEIFSDTAKKLIFF
jgi:hypothetical protein